MSDKASGLDRIHRASGCLVRISYGGFALLYLLGCTYSVYRDPPSLWGVVVAALTNIAVISARRFTVLTIAAGTSSLVTSVYLAVRTELGAEVSPDFFAGVLAEIGGTRPLSVLMAEQVDALREWARSRTVPAD